VEKHSKHKDACRCRTARQISMNKDELSFYRQPKHATTKMTEKCQHEFSKRIGSSLIPSTALRIPYRTQNCTGKKNQNQTHLSSKKIQLLRNSLPHRLLTKTIVGVSDERRESFLFSSSQLLETFLTHSRTQEVLT
jgi:hypothetical protein